MYQGDAGHTGYVPLTLNSANFAKAWDFTDPNPAGGRPFLNGVAVANGIVYLTGWINKLYSLDEATGALKWTHDFAINIGPNGSAFLQTAPSIYRGNVYVSGHVDFTQNSIVDPEGVVFAADSQTGNVKFFSRYGSQSEHSLSPTFANDVMYVSGGYYGGIVYAYSLLAKPDSSGEVTPLWATTRVDGNAYTLGTPTTDGVNVYHVDGDDLDAYSVATGSLAFAVRDTDAPNLGYEYNGAPILGSNHNILALSGSITTVYGLTPTYARPLIYYDTTTRAIVWKTAGFYDTTPALAKGVVYIARNAPTPVLEALSESDGHILWSWPIPAGDNSFYHNTIVTDNLVFVTTDKHIFAIDLATHAMVWSYEANGALALSRNGTLFVNTGQFNSDGHLLAIKMK